MILLNEPEKGFSPFECVTKTSETRISKKHKIKVYVIISKPRLKKQHAIPAAEIKNASIRTSISG